MSEHDPLQSLWKSQKQEDFSMSLADIHARAERFQSRIRLRNWIEYVAALAVSAFFLWIAVTAPAPLIQVGAVLLVLAALYVAWKLHTLGRAASAREMSRTESWADFHRGELVRQRDALRTVWRWYLAPFAPGMAVFLAGAAFDPHMDAPLAAKLILFAVGATTVGAMFAAIAWLNARAARTLDKEIDALDRARGG